MERRQSFQQMVLDELDIYMQKKPKNSLTLFTKINSKWIVDLNVKCKTRQPLGDNTGENLDDLGYGNDFLDVTPKAQAMKEITDKQDFIKIKNSCAAKGNAKHMRKQATDWENISAKDKSDKELLSKIYKDLLKSTLSKF